MVYTERKNDRLEIWKDIKGYEGFYQSSTFGRARSIDTYRKSRNGTVRFCKGKILKPKTTKDGYLQVGLCKNDKRKIFYVHKLVVEAFLEIPEELKHLKGTRYLQVNHKDENKQNNSVNNLEWCSYSYNINFGTRNEKVAAKNTNGKLSKPVLQYTLDGEFVKEWKSAKQAEREGRFDHGNISACCRGELKKYKDFIWRYK